MGETRVLLEKSKPGSEQEILLISSHMQILDFNFYICVLVCMRTY